MKTYADSGVHVDLGDKASQILYEAAKKTWIHRRGRFGEIFLPLDHFGGLRAIDISQLPQGSLMGFNLDGIGTKTLIASSIQRYDTIAFDLFAMVCDDAVIQGAEPVLLGSILDVNSLVERDPHRDRLSIIEELAKGYVEAARLAHVAVINGELAELGMSIGPSDRFRFNWGASLLWIARKDRLISGEKLKEGDLIVALREDGFRSNGYSLLRRALAKSYGPSWHKMTFQNSTLGEIALQPSTIYTKAVLAMTGGFEHQPQADIHGAVHITGGGIPSKLGRFLKKWHLGASLDDLFEPHPLMLHLQKLHSITDEEAYRTWNMGQGLFIITPNPDPILQIALDYHIQAKIVGSIVSQPKISLRSQGFSNKNNWLYF